MTTSHATRTGTSASAYDYVVVGGGTAGCVLAARLSADSGVPVLLLEAGTADPPAAMADPLAWPGLAGTAVDWALRTVPQPALDGAVLPFPRGRVLGGSSGINGMMHIRGDRTAFDGWAAAGGRPWSYDALLPYFRRSERAANGDPAFRGHDGPMVVGPGPAVDPLWEACFEAAVEAGHRRNPDSNAASGTGVSWNDMNVVAGRRQTAADAYLDRAARDRSNLTIVVGATVHRLVMADTTCRGVEYDLAGRLFTATAAAEVVLTAGAIGSPELLLRSGIGPAGHLAAVGVDITADLPGVGSNLQDHPKSQVAYSSPGPVRSGVYARKPHVLMSSTTPSLPDLQLIFIELPVHPRWLPGPEDGFSVIYSLMLPASSGTVRLAGPGPHTLPLIDPGYLTDPGDIERMLSGLSAARDIAAAPALAPFRDKALHPAAADDTNLRGYLRETVTSYFHPVGSCALGSGPDTVVDPQLRVHGVDRLRVADASVFPSLVSGNTNATVLAVAERAADLVIGAASE